MTFPGRFNEGLSRWLEGFHTAVLSFWNSKVVKFGCLADSTGGNVNSDGPLTEYYNPVALNGGEGKRGAERGTKSLNMSPYPISINTYTYAPYCISNLVNI